MSLNEHRGCDCAQVQGGRTSGFWKEVEKKKAEGKSEETAVAEVVQQIKEDVKEQSS